MLRDTMQTDTQTHRHTRTHMQKCPQTRVTTCSSSACGGEPTGEGEADRERAVDGGVKPRVRGGTCTRRFVQCGLLEKSSEGIVLRRLTCIGDGGPTAVSSVCVPFSYTFLTTAATPVLLTLVACNTAIEQQTHTTSGAARHTLHLLHAATHE